MLNFTFDMKLDVFIKLPLSTLFIIIFPRLSLGPPNDPEKAAASLLEHALCFMCSTKLFVQFLFCLSVVLFVCFCFACDICMVHV